MEAGIWSIWDRNPTSNELKQTNMYKVGDKVTIRRDLKAGNEYGNISVNVDMVGLNGKLATITKVYPSSYLINLGNKCLCWTSEMFESSPSSKLFPLL